MWVLLNHIRFTINGKYGFIIATSLSNIWNGRNVASTKIKVGIQDAADTVVPKTGDRYFFNKSRKRRKNGQKVILGIGVSSSYLFSSHYSVQFLSHATVRIIFLNWLKFRQQLAFSLSLSLLLSFSLSLTLFSKTISSFHWEKNSFRMQESRGQLLLFRGHSSHFFYLSLLF